MKVPKTTSIVLVVLSSLTFLNFILKYYTYFVLIASSTKAQQEQQQQQQQQGQQGEHHHIPELAQETGEIPHPHELFVPLLTFIPTKSPVLTRPWVLLTSGFIEENFIELFISFILIFYLGKYLETIWGSKEFSKFIIINVLISNLIIYIYYNLKSFIVELTDEYLPPVILSSMSINIGLIIAMKQRIPKHYLIFFKGNLRIKVTYLPFLTILLTWILSLLSEEFYILFVMSIVGFMVSWTYLRFFKTGANERQLYILPFALTHKRKNRFNTTTSVNNNDGHILDSSLASSSNSINNNNGFSLDDDTVKGDRSEQFALYTFFPYPLSIPIKFIANFIFEILVDHKLLNRRDFKNYDNEEEDNTSNVNVNHVRGISNRYEDVDKLKNNLFGLSALNGAQSVSTISMASSMKKFWDWIIPTTNSKSHEASNIKINMDRRRKLALKEIE
ncbi:conserved hypothetical protein [Candida dubliniensis CD36]|uniref:Uncharacterized protein n=1 Tax=Candida dubliniensis (strain CD36 / ATCC MYA-646 / CBS 7987 / NCPF 3949 / NRRL Y-17841) TaxID=573826 RepID=B9W9P1_CANDC|nr:conserved hypothetical protein [Candida dubliniensis CD36]CAX45526.1 conserved hypothetical protein [Candida dubliniensis CD36]